MKVICYSTNHILKQNIIMCFKYQNVELAGNRNTSGHIFVAEAKSWRKAQNHCRNLSLDLVGIQSAEENEAVHNLSVSQNMWIGLFRDPWLWSDGSNSSFRYWKPIRQSFLTKGCAAAVFRDEGQWNDVRCEGKLKFVCQGRKWLFLCLWCSTCFPSAKYLC